MSTRSIRRVLAITAGTIAASAGVATPAMADSVGCTWAEGSGASYVCLGIYGSGTYVNQFRVTRNHQYNSICGYRARVSVNQPTSTDYNYYSGTHTGCSWNTAWMDFYPRRSYQHDTKVCGHWYESGKWLSGVPCNKVLR